MDELQDDATFQQDAEFYSEGLAVLPVDIIVAQAKDGTVSNEQREWRFTGVTTYDFREGALKGFGIGGAVRWEDEAATGYLQIVQGERRCPDLRTAEFVVEQIARRDVSQHTAKCARLGMDNFVGSAGLDDEFDDPIPPGH